MQYNEVYFSQGETAAQRHKTLSAHGPHTLIKRLQEEGLLEAVGRPIEGADPGPDDKVSVCQHESSMFIVTRNLRYDYLQVERSVPTKLKGVSHA